MDKDGSILTVLYGGKDPVKIEKAFPYKPNWKKWKKPLTFIAVALAITGVGFGVGALLGMQATIPAAVPLIGGMTVPAPAFYCQPTGFNWKRANINDINGVKCGHKKIRFKPV